MKLQFAFEGASRLSTLATLALVLTGRPLLAGEMPLVQAGAVWKYSDTGADLGTAWRAPAFNDGAWAAGPAQLGYGDGDEATVINGGPAGSRFITTYFRRAFVLNDPPAFSQLTLRLLRDDGAVVYLNGVEVFRDNLPPGPIGHSTLAASALGSTVENTFITATLPSYPLVQGTNVLAVEVHQSSPSSSDVSFDLELIGHPGVPRLGHVVAWGSGGWGQSVVPADLGPVVAVSAGMYHSLALKPEGTVVSWGGAGTDYQEAGFVPEGLRDVVAISAGAALSVALKVDGTVVCWGLEGYANVPPGLNEVIAVAAGGYHALALKRNGRVVGWGQSEYGQTSPPANLTNAVAIAAGGHHSLALRANGTVVGFGYNGSGETMPPAGLSNVIAIAAGANQSLALRADSTVVAWGANYFGQTNVPAGLSNVVAISAGDGFNLALRRDGSVVAWGRGDHGQTNPPASLTNVLAIEAGTSHSLALVPPAPPLTLADAVDAPQLVWTTGGAVDWFAQTAMTHDGVDAAQGTVNIVDDRSWIATTVTGPARLGFHWKCSTRWPTYDRLAFYVDEQLQGSIPGDADWQAASFLVPAGTHVLKWVFEVDSEPTAGLYNAWLDQVTMAPVLQPGVTVAWVTNHPGGMSGILHVDSSGNAYLAGQSQVIKFAPDGRRLWVAPFDRPGGAHGGRGWPTALTVNDAGTVFVTGYSSRESADYDWMTVKYDADGNLLWRQIFGGVNTHDTASAISVDTAANVYVTGSENENSGAGFLVTLKYGPAGNLLWTARYRGDYDAAYGRAVAVDAAGNACVIGTANSWRTYFDWVVLKYDREGNRLWVATFGSGEGDDQPGALTLDASGNLFVTGLTRTNAVYHCLTVKYSPDGQPLWLAYDADRQTCGNGGHAIGLDAIGNVYVAATGHPDGNNEERLGFATLKYDPAGHPLWAARFFGTYHGGSGFAVDRPGNVYITAALGEYADQAEPVTIKYDPQGNQAWAMPFPLNGRWGEIFMLGLGPDASVYTAGTAYEGGNDYQYLLVKYAQAPVSPSLATALDWPGPWTTGSKPWFGQTAVTADGVDAAQSATNLTCDDHGWLKATVTGPGTIRFRWKAQIEGAESFVAFYVAGGSGTWPQAIYLHESTDWRTETSYFGPGSHDLFWVVYGNCANYDEQAIAWLDQVEIMPSTETNAPTPFVERRVNLAGIELVATPPAHVQTYAVEDQPPAGWAVDNITHGGVFDPATGKVKFGPFYDAEPRTLRYDVFPPPGTLGVFTFAGQAAADGVTTPIGGDQQCVLAGFHPADLDAPDGQMTVGEITAYGAAWLRGESWPVEPVPIPMDYVTRAAMLWRAGECYQVDHTVTNAPLWWVKCDEAGSAGAPLPAALVGDSPGAERQMPRAFVPGESFEVTVSVTPAGAWAYVLEEEVPWRWGVTNISEGGRWDSVSSSVRWGLFLDSAPRTLSYQVIPPVTASGLERVHGRASFDGTTHVISGPSEVAEGCRMRVTPTVQPGEHLFTFTGRAGARLRIEASSDLITWTGLGEATIGATPVVLGDPGAAQFPQRFYRAIQVW